MSEIKSRIITSGHEKESSWPSRFGTGEHGYFRYEEEMKKSEVQRFGQAPMYFSDTMEPFFHPRAKKLVESLKELRALDKATGTITTDVHEEPPQSYRKAMEQEIRAAKRKELRDTFEIVKAGNGVLTREQREEARARDDQLSAVAGVDLRKKILGRS